MEPPATLARFDRFPAASMVPRGAFVLGLDGVERSSLRWGMFGALSIAVAAGFVVGWILGADNARVSASRRSPKTSAISEKSTAPGKLSAIRKSQ